MINYKELEREHEFDVYDKRDIVLVKGKGSKVWDDKGREYIDCVAGHGVANLGHCNEIVITAINNQSKKLVTCSGIFYNDTRALLMEKLVEITPKNLKRIFLCNSGAESIEAAIKFSRFTKEKTEFICAIHSFHGRTFGALSATFNPLYKREFEPLVPGFNFVSFNNIEKLKDKINDNTAGIILEVIQGEGGVNVGKKEYFEEVRKICDEKDILLIIDEVQTGFCRTGKMFACDHFDLEPDILCLSKSIAGGLPMGAVLCSEKIKIPANKHGTTFGGNPLVCAASIAAIDFMIENKLDRQSEEKGNYLVNKIKNHKLSKVKEIRHLGLMIGIELEEKSKPYILELLNEGVLALAAGPNVIRLLPPLTINYEEIDFVAEKIIRVLS